MCHIQLGASIEMRILLSQRYFLWAIHTFPFQQRKRRKNHFAGHHEECPLCVCCRSFTDLMPSCLSLSSLIYRHIISLLFLHFAFCLGLSVTHLWRYHFHQHKVKHKISFKRKEIKRHKMKFMLKHFFIFIALDLMRRKLIKKAKEKGK